MSALDLELVRVLDEHRAAIQRDTAALGELLAVAVPASWPQFPEAFSTKPEHDLDWPSYFFVDRRASALVGNGGFAGPPGDSGEVEIGYEVAP
jgi:[ribosomal protein S5]-alanine N-acetyltransferase